MVHKREKLKNIDPTTMTLLTTIGTQLATKAKGKGEEAELAKVGLQLLPKKKYRVQYKILPWGGYLTKTFDTPQEAKAFSEEQLGRGMTDVHTKEVLF